MHIRWMGRRGLRWEGVVPLVETELRTQAPPDIIILHAGGNDIGFTPVGELARQIRDDLHKLKEYLPLTLFVWSDLLPRQQWLPTLPIATLENSRKRINRSAASCCIYLGGRHIYHEDIVYSDNSLFRPDGVHLSDRGNQIFLLSLKSAIILFITSEDLTCGKTF